MTLFLADSPRAAKVIAPRTSTYAGAVSPPGPRARNADG
ncbi:hypothetical protein OCO_12130 [Mycobacterium intracellulare MOTT-02]|uniref:Uncharacterized protein n=3 Tax=Mycobacterium intracellulare TaxID=1767 RepID=X8CNH1_MYCIT|nr:hypothetical protein OCU_12090 [Mycobacterium intracellulare ATCC 13950]AFC47576.1 hypothetical protein OCO_12130 [Mycobacterium intracellulare MOTT-02]AFS13334.1 Hypothetical protein MIP_01936 [Mycobacterium intracellulare subsp. intracellulare MTCC 9506]EUA25948.1 hypothetical protein I548_4040 [Mycobacterium intracellulare]EUA57927.1 hypothetical protein I550_1059 [Mycobacterium intracellulare 1956]